MGDAMAYAIAHVHGGVLRIDDDGVVWRLKESRRGAWVDVPTRRAEHPGGKGYLRVSLHVPILKRLAIVMAHRLVYEWHVGPIPFGMEINHKDLVKTNNRPNNLEVVTGVENNRHSRAHGRTPPWALAKTQAGREWRPGQKMLTEKQKAEAIRMRQAGALLRTIAESLGISITRAHSITQVAR
jgi:hypothetical protein